ncbi:MAG: PEP/pyruvate-binding domain-containing protein [Acidobacteriota bacterium]
MFSVRRFNDLMPFRVHEVLLVSAPYDAFILQEDAHLTEKLFFEYKEISLSTAPRFTHAVKSEEAFRRMAERRFDLVLTMAGLADTDLEAFAERVRREAPGLPVVALALDQQETRELERLADAGLLDGYFLWTGDNAVLLAVIKSVEDRRNVDHDVAEGNVRVILMLEDSPQYFSPFLGLLYRELMRQSFSLYAEGQSELYRRMYMKSRPKVLHARKFEDGLALFERYRNNVLAVISDIGLPRGGRLEPEAGLVLARHVREHDPDLPLVLQSADAGHREQAEKLGALFLDKHSPALLGAIRQFLSLHLGFGDFIFRTPGGAEYDRARDLRELEEKLATVPEEILAYHASRNHISIWLMARSEFELAEELRKQRVTDFASIADMRRHVLTVLRQNRERLHRGIVTDFEPERLAGECFCRIGSGPLGGKARGLAFLYQALADLGPADFGGLPVRIPPTVVLAADLFGAFLEANHLREWALKDRTDAELAGAFERARLAEDLVEQLREIVERWEMPLAVRSSSVLEDSLYQPLAGIYLTIMLPNRHRDPEFRLQELCRAVKLVWASTFYGRARKYLEATENRVEQEQMAVIIQPVVGRRFGARYYPHFAGVAQSFNYYPFGPQRPEDGVVHLALGLGRQVVDGGQALRFSPRHPKVLPQLARPEPFLKHSQRNFWAVDLSKDTPFDRDNPLDTLRQWDLKAAEEDGTLPAAGSVYCPQDDAIRDDLSLPGPRIVTFNNILKYKAIPLPQALIKLLEIAEEGMACPAEVEFACDMGDWGTWPRAKSSTGPTLYVLQMRPLQTRRRIVEQAAPQFQVEDLVCSTDTALGHGYFSDLCDVVFVRRERWKPELNRSVVGELARINEELVAEKRHYVLIGPGRWGSADEWLGIPVQWVHISGAKVIVEASPDGYWVDPSQGSHFFHNITAQGVGYLTLPPGETSSERFLDWEWLESRPVHCQTETVRHVRLEKPLRVWLDGRNRRGLIAKPAR